MIRCPKCKALVELGEVKEHNCFAHFTDDDWLNIGWVGEL